LFQSSSLSLCVSSVLPSFRSFYLTFLCFFPFSFLR
jgi:hypothetical protein